MEAVVSGATGLQESRNTYDWLGHGVYFWENSPARAISFAEELRSNARNRFINKIEKPAVIGAVLDLGFCLDLLDFENLSFLKKAYTFLLDSQPDLPKNLKAGGSPDLLLRYLDCAVVEMLHGVRESTMDIPYDSVRGVFSEGTELYPNAGFREKDHIQICIRNPNCIKGFFIPREFNPKYPAV
jgi:hypothetical protein